MGKAEKMMEQQAKKLCLQGYKPDQIVKMTGVSRYWLDLKMPTWRKRL